MHVYVYIYLAKESNIFNLEARVLAHVWMFCVPPCVEYPYTNSYTYTEYCVWIFYVCISILDVCIHTHVCIFVLYVIQKHAYVYMFGCLCTCVRVYVWIHVYLSLYITVCAYILCTCMCLDICAHMYKYLQVYINTQKPPLGVNYCTVTQKLSSNTPPPFPSCTNAHINMCVCVCV